MKSKQVAGIGFGERAAIEFQKALGAEEFANLAGRCWPCWDSTVGLILFVDGKPTLMSSCVMDVFKARHRRDVVRVPNLEDTNWEYYAINEATLPVVGRAGNVAVVHLGDRETPYPFLPFENEDLDALPSGSSGKDLFLAAVEASKTSDFQAVVIRHDGYILEQFPRLQKLLGDPDDATSWIPEDWYEPLPPGSVEFGSSLIHARSEESEASTVEWARLPFSTFNFYWVRPNSSESSNTASSGHHQTHVV